MKTVFTFTSEFYDDEETLCERITHESSEECPTIDYAVETMRKFLSAAFGYAITLDYRIGDSK